MLYCPIFWRNTVPIFGAFGHQETAQVKRDCFLFFGTVQLFAVGDLFFGTVQHLCCLGVVFWDSAALLLVLLQKCCTVPKLSWLAAKSFGTVNHFCCTDLRVNIWYFPPKYTNLVVNGGSLHIYIQIYRFKKNVCIYICLQCYRYMHPSLQEPGRAAKRRKDAKLQVEAKRP